MTENSLRKTGFGWSIAVLTIFLIPFESYSWWDSALFLYSICVILATACLWIWGMWWWRSKTHSDMFMMVALLLVGLDVAMSTNLFARWNFIYRPGYYEEILTNDLWAYRISLEVLVILWFFWWSVGRFFGERACKEGRNDCINGICKEAVNEFAFLNARILEGELRLEGHTHDGEGIVIAAKIVIKTPEGLENGSV